MRNYATTRDCDQCKGTGYWIADIKCPCCKGKGYVKHEIIGKK